MKHLYILLIALLSFTAYSCVYPDDDEIINAYKYNPDNDKSDSSDEQPSDSGKTDDKSDKSEESEKEEDTSVVDLGLPSGTKWCICNVGATSAEEYGSYYTWSDAKENIPNGYAMPNYNQARELVNQCSWTWTSINGIYGYKGTGPNKKTIFLPAGGLYEQYSYGMDINWLGEGGAYWVDYDNTSEYSTNPSASAILFLHEDIVPIAPKMSGEAQSSKLALRCVKK